MTNGKITTEWMEYANNDLRSADFLRQLIPQPWEIIAYHAQQAVEKALKGLLVAKDIRPPRTHDLDELIDLFDGIDSLECMRQRA